MSELMQNKVELCKIYRHFKGKLYFTRAIATHSETGEDMVVYQALYDDFRIYTRPLSIFLEDVDPNREGNITHQTKRFELFKEVQDK